MNDLENRVSRLERSARRWRLASLSLLCLLGSVFWMGQIRMTGEGGISSNKITAQKLVITDADSKSRLILAAEKGSPSLEIKDTDDHTLLSLSSDGKAATIIIQDAQGKKLFSAPQ